MDDPGRAPRQRSLQRFGEVDRASSGIRGPPQGEPVRADADQLVAHRGASRLVPGGKGRTVEPGRSGLIASPAALAPGWVPGPVIARSALTASPRPALPA